MKKILISSLLFAASLFANDQALINKVSTIGLFKSPQLKVTKVVDLGSLYLVGAENTLQDKRVMPVEAFVSKDLKYVILGKAFEAENGTEVYLPKDMNEYKDVASFTIGTGKKEFFLATDPECPYCVNLEKELDKLLTKEKLKEIKIHVLLFPLPFHKEAKPMSYYILNQGSAEEKHIAMKKIMLDNDKSYKDAKYSSNELAKFDEKLEKQLQAIQKLGINGTPTILDANGRKVNPDSLFK